MSDITLEEVNACVKRLKTGKAPGPDAIPIEQYKNSDEACSELYYLLSTMWENEMIPDEFVLGEMMMMYKKKCKDDRANY